MSNTLEIVRSIVGRRHKITRTEMVEILLAISMDIVPASTITGRSADGVLYVGGEWITDPAEERQATAVAWERMCKGITCVSVLPVVHYRDEDETVEGLGVRYDQPGTMHPLQRAELLFVSSDLEGREYDQIGQLRGRAKRLLIITGEPSQPESKPINVPGWIERLRKHERIDGKWIRIHDDGVLEMRDPNDGQSSSPKNKRRFQYRVDRDTGYIEQRVLPSEW